MRIGIDLGGTKIEGIALADTGEVLWRDRVPTPGFTGSEPAQYSKILEAIVGLVNQIQLDTGRVGSVGVGSPGSVSAVSGRVKNSNTLCLNDRPLREDLAAALGCAIRFANDADCMSLSEACDGVAEGASSVFGVIIGTGVGGGLVFGQSLLQGANGIAGEWGHNPLPDRYLASNALPRHCYCGADNCVETWLSGAGLRCSYEEFQAVQADSVRIDSEVSTPEIVDKALNGEPAAQLAMNQYFDQLAGALATVINIVDPEVIVLAGGLSNIRSLYDEVPKRWTSAVFSDQVVTRLVQANHGDASGVRGAAWLWPINGVVISAG